MAGQPENPPATADKRVVVALESEMRVSYLDYAMSVIVGRALPDARDGLKPVQRRILYAMQDMGNTHERPSKKSARVVGEVLGKYHPHGDVAVYDAMVRMAQTFSLRYPLVEGQGNFGSVDGDSPAAMRYTEVRLSAISGEMLAELDMETVAFTDNFDGTLKEPVVLPAILPNLLVNGSSGIAVGMATNIPPHNLGEVVDGLVMLIDNPDATVRDLMEPVRGPDFPTGGIICGLSGIAAAYATGRGAVRVRARTAVEGGENDRKRIVVSEIPYQVNKSTLLETMADLVREKRLEGIADIRDESDREGLRIVADLKRDAVPEVVLNQLFKHTQLEITFGVINLALVDGKPEVLDLKRILQCYLRHREEMVRKRTEFELRRAKKRLHIVEGLQIAIDHLDEVIALIRGSADAAEASAGLISKFGMSAEQAKAVLEMKLQKLTGLERAALVEEAAQLRAQIAELERILSSEAEILKIIRAELLELKERYGDARRTEITGEAEEIDIEDLIPDEAVVITLTNSDYLKRLPLAEYRQQRRGGKGLIGIETKEEDFVVSVFVTRTHNYILFFTSFGKVYWLKAYRIPEGGRHSRGKAVVNLLPGLEKGETLSAAIPVRDFDGTHYVIFATRRGVIKKTLLSAFRNPRTSGIRAIQLEEGDELVDTKVSDGTMEVILATKEGLAVRFDEKAVRPMGRTAYGVTGVRLRGSDEVVSMEPVRPGMDLLTVTEKGFGKRTPVDEYRKTARGAHGVKTVTVTEKNGPVVAVKVVGNGDELLLTTERGMTIRIPAASIRQTGRAAQGVYLIRVEEGDHVRGVEKLVSEQMERKEVELAPAPPPRQPEGPPEKVILPREGDSDE